MRKGIEYTGVAEQVPGALSIPGAVKAAKNNFYAAAAPSVREDGTKGYSVGSVWADQAHKLLWFCIDDTTGAADWRQIPVLPTVPLNNWWSATSPTVTDDSVAGYSVGSAWADQTGKALWFCTDDTAGAAVWTQVV